MNDERVTAGARRVLSVGSGACGATDIGRRRANNEDAFHVSADGPVLAVADGLGGLPAGEVASAIAISAAATMLEGRVHECVDEVVALEMLSDVFRAANHAIHEDAIREPARRGMATTLVAGMVADDTLYVSHVGDVRAYRLRDRVLERLTDDHTTAWELVEAGILSEEEARLHPLRNSLTRVLGIHERADASFETVPLRPGDLVLLCSDGLWEPVRHDEITSVLANRASDLSARAVLLLDRALEAGGPDNVTVVLYEHGR